MSTWAEQTVVIMGLAKSGVAAAKYLHQAGATVIANDAKAQTACPEANELTELGIKVICGGHPTDLISDEVDVVIKNPGVPYHIAPIQEAFARKIPIITEVELAATILQAHLVGITGSNGKTTTTTLVGQMLTAGNLQTTVAGNIGTALIDVAPKLTEDQWLVAELSSFQLKGTAKFHPHVAACLNIYPAHLDYHQTLEDYWQSKAKLFQNQTASDFAVLNKDSQICRQIAEKVAAELIWFSRTQTLEQGVYVKAEQIVAKMPRQAEITILPVGDISLPGDFNLENCLAATAIALCCGCSPEAIAEVLRSFRGVEHRLEFVREVQGAAYYNDSKATNPQAATKAIQSFDDPLIWIAGGLDRGINFTEMVPVMSEHVKTLIAYGESAEILLERAKEANVPNCVQVTEIDEAVKQAFLQAEAGDVVLLSPACASWDRYTSFEERGSIFKQAVHKL